MGMGDKGVGNVKRLFPCSELQQLFGFGHHQKLISIADAVGVEGPCAVLHFLGAEGAVHVFINVIEAHAIGGETHYSPKLLLQLSHRLVQTDAHLLHFVLTVNQYICMKLGPQVNLSQWLQLPVLGHQTVVPSNRESTQTQCPKDSPKPS